MDAKIKATIDRLQDVRSQLKELEKLNKELTEELKIAIQTECGSANCEYIHGKIKAVVGEVSKDIVDTDKLKREYPEIRERCLKPSNYTTLTLKPR